MKAVLAEIETEVVSTDDEDSLLSRLGQLDLLLTWLWRVHGIDYYGGKELLLEADYMDRSNMNRTVRGQRPEEGEEQDEAEGVCWELMDGSLMLHYSSNLFAGCIGLY